MKIRIVFQSGQSWKFAEREGWRPDHEFVGRNETVLHMVRDVQEKFGPRVAESHTFLGSFSIRIREESEFELHNMLGESAENMSETGAAPDSAGKGNPNDVT